MPPHTWVDFDIKCALGRSATGTYDLKVTVADGATHHLKDLPCGSKNFNRLDWLGFVSSATHEATFYIDDLHLDSSQP